MKDFKVKCVESCCVNFTEGKVYEVENGILYDDFGFAHDNSGFRYDSLAKNINVLWAWFELCEPEQLSDAETKYDDVRQAKMALNSFYGQNAFRTCGIKKVIFNDPATIVLWAMELRQSLTLRENTSTLKKV